MSHRLRICSRVTVNPSGSADVCQLCNDYPSGQLLFSSAYPPIFNTGLGDGTFPPAYKHAIGRVNL